MDSPLTLLPVAASGLSSDKVAGLWIDVEPAQRDLQ